MNTEIKFPAFEFKHRSFTTAAQQKGDWEVKYYSVIGRLAISIWDKDASGVYAVGTDGVKIEAKSYLEAKSFLKICQKADREDWTGLRLTEELRKKQNPAWWKSLTKVG